MDLEEALDRHRRLLEEGWTGRFTADEPRLSKMKASYESLGLEVRLETGIPDDNSECSACLTLPGYVDRYKTIYTRDGTGKASDDSKDLF